MKVVDKKIEIETHIGEIKEALYAKEQFELEVVPL